MSFRKELLFILALSPLIFQEIPIIIKLHEVRLGGGSEKDLLSPMP